MSPHSPPRRRTAMGVLAGTALVMPLLAAAPAQAAPCHLSGPNGSCNGTFHQPGSPGGGGSPGGSGGGDSGPVAPPDPVGLNPNQGQGFVQVPGNPAPPQPAAPATADLVAQARAAAAFPVPVVHTAPKGKTFVRLRTSLWVDGFEVVKTKPITVGNQTVQLTGEPAKVVWDLKEASHTCYTAGSEDGKACNYTFQRPSADQPGGAYQISATIYWNVTWACDGADCDEPGGNLGQQVMPSAGTPLVVGEIQTNTGQ
jgi:hypothetical protein